MRATYHFGRACPHVSCGRFSGKPVRRHCGLTRYVCMYVNVKIRGTSTRARTRAHRPAAPRRSGATASFPLPSLTLRGSSPAHSSCIHSTTPRRISDRAKASHLAFTRYCHYQYRMVHGVQKGGRGGRRLLRNRRAIVMQ